MYGVLILNTNSESIDFSNIKTQLNNWAQTLGFQRCGVASVHVGQHAQHLQNWLAQHFHADMTYMERHADLRCDPTALLPGTLRIIMVRMNYWPNASDAWQQLNTPNQAYIARYALGRDYHKLMRKRLTQLAKQLENHIGSFGYRAFVDSAPVLEKALAEQAGLGWIGKHTLLIDRQQGSYFFLGALFTDLPLPLDDSTTSHCGSCSACLDICPTKAIVAPYQLDARKCIAYLTIENKGPIPEAFRTAIGNRIFGCDDCQLICPWNKFAQLTAELDFTPRHQLDRITLLELFCWSEADYLKNTEGSPIRRTGYIGWLRNLAIGLGNAPAHPDIITALEQRQNIQPDWLAEHVTWALQRQRLCSAQLPPFA